MIDLDLVEARWRVGHIWTSELVHVAKELRAAGLDAPALDRLEEARGARAARDQFELALRQLGGGRMTASQAARVLARRFATQLLAGEITPRAGTKAIARVRWKGGPDVDGELRAFSELDDRYDQVGATRLARFRVVRLDRETRTEARRLLA